MSEMRRPLPANRASVPTMWVAVDHQETGGGHVSLTDASEPDLVTIIIFAVALGVFMGVLGLVRRWRGWFE